MNAIYLLAAIFAVAVAYPQHGHEHHGHEVHHNHGGGDGHKHSFFKHGDVAHHGSSYANVERHDGKDHEVHFKAHPEYHYGFKVDDEHTKDHKSKHEERDGYKVKGSYSLVEPDGKTIRVVDYTADKKQGFIAKVSYKHHH